MSLLQMVVRSGKYEMVQPLHQAGLSSRVWQELTNYTRLHIQLQIKQSC